MSKLGTCVVHLVWAPLGPSALETFLGSYRSRAAGAEHTLLLLLNGFAPGQDTSPWEDLAGEVPHQKLRLDEPVLDLAAYSTAVERVPAERYCFVNSHSEPRVDGWLGKLQAALEEPRVGLVAATGSWGSIRSYQRFMLGLGGPYATVFEERKRTNETLAAVASAQPSAQPQQGRRPLRFLSALLQQSYGFAPFPAHHLRTNGLMIDAETIRQLRWPAPVRKADAYRLESGRRSITAQVQGLGYEVRVVGSDGSAHPPERWPRSGTFWQSTQESLLIADNQTRAYDRADAATREVLARFAWGAAQAD